MSIVKNTKLSTAEKIALFRSLFSGLTHVYGTYNPKTGRSRQEKKPVTDKTIFLHLKGKQPYGVYLLNGKQTRAIAVDFDDTDLFPPVEFVNVAQHYCLPSYIETSKSKGFHIWIFFNEKGVKAAKARMIVKHILDEIGHPNVEIFPKRDFLDNAVYFGNFINTPFFGGLVPKGKTVFIDPYTLKPYPDQWEFLSSAERVTEDILDDIIDSNNLMVPRVDNKPEQNGSKLKSGCNFGLPLCAQRMLDEGVSKFQRISCFRLAVHFKRLGFPNDLAVEKLKNWARKNKPEDGKRIITEKEIISQTKDAYGKDYRGYGCDWEAVRSFCQPSCSILKRSNEIRA